ncbi:uncharacterized protein RAG0_14718 [Rhynchosporium agropyri]|uniref:Peptidase S8/S53 domain-containing protein n=1 Tax=Rhynchosporium agropyri TaxID=914238 RepID=A0A1E1LI11_9HELO|nr:uncharacterized protein RAG0_14718 [Rhynchosporium agropyri]
MSLYLFEVPSNKLWQDLHLLLVPLRNMGVRRDVTFPASMTGVFCINSASGDGASSNLNPELKSMTGKSVATPIAAAIAALVLEHVIQNDPESCLAKQLDELEGVPENPRYLH